MNLRNSFLYQPPYCRLLLVLLLFNLMPFMPSPVNYEGGLNVKVQHQQNKQTPWPDTASELYRPSDSRLSAKLVPTFADRGCSVVRAEDPLRPYFRISRPKPLLFLPGSSSIVLTRLSDPVPDPLHLRKSGSAGNRNRTSGVVSRNSGY
jgi:hypothetical protein